MSNIIIDSYVRSILLEKPFKREYLCRLVKRAWRTGVWYKLSIEQRSLLYLTSKIVEVVRSKVLEKLIEEIAYMIELSTLKGKAIYYGVILALRRIHILGSKVLNDIKNCSS